MDEQNQEGKEPITWELKPVRAGDLIPNAKNPKVKDKKGTTRLRHSLDKFGIVYDGIANLDNRIIDGHSRLELKKNPEAVLMYFFPSRMLTDDEYNEMNAIFDKANAGDVDEQLLEETFKDEFFDEWYLNKRVKEDKRVAHPDTVKGLGNKRNWIYDYFGDVFMLDDDLKGLVRLHTKRKEENTVTPRQAYDIIQLNGNIAAAMGCYLFGFNKSIQPMNYTGLKPFQLSGYVNAAGMGLLKGSMLKFNPQIRCNNDVYISLLNAFHHRMAFIDNRFAVSQKGVQDTVGGMAVERTIQVEEKDFELLKQYFGSAVKLKGDKARNKYSKVLKFPF